MFTMEFVSVFSEFLSLAIIYIRAYLSFLVSIGLLVGLGDVEKVKKKGHLK